MACNVKRCDRWVPVTLQSPTAPTDGETTSTFSDTKRAYAIIRGRVGMEQSRGEQIQAVAHFDITLRYDEDIKLDLAPGQL